MLRRLRMAASTFWLLIAVVLVGLSVWSSLSRFGVEYQASNGDVNGISSEGQNLLIFHSDSSDWLVLHPARAPLTGWFFHKFPRNPYPPKLTTKWSSKSFSLVVPYWIPTLFAVMVAASPWVGFRFSLRTMLIATTLIAAALGLIVWASR